jgi:hypothetical protein
MTFRRAAVALAGALLVIVSGAGAATAPPGRSSAVQLLGVTDGMLLTPETTLNVRVSPELGRVDSVALVFRPERSAVSTPIGVDRTSVEPSFGPDCGERPCVKTDEFSIAIGDALNRVGEGPGTVIAFVNGDFDHPYVVGDVYSDATPPRASFVAPLFASRPREGGWEVVAHTDDENVAAVKVKWTLLPVGTRAIPQFEQHLLGDNLTPGGHASCVPTSAAANFQWLADTVQWFVTPTAFCGGDAKCFVTLLGFAMQTGVGGGGTSGAGFEDGIVNYLDALFGLERDVDYELVHDTSGVNGFSPERIVEEFAAGGVVNLGLHNQAGDPAFGHVVPLANAKLNADGTATITVMDENVEPPGSATGQFRTFVLSADGTIPWSSAKTTYYDPPSGRVRVDELLSVHPFLFAFPPTASPQAVTSGEVPGTLEGAGRTWVGRFEPPPGLDGPFLLVSESTDESGHTQRDYQYVGPTERG